MKKFKSIAEAVLILSLVVVSGIALQKETAYYCEERSLAMNCDSLSKYYSLDNGKCNNKELGNKLCSSGWVLLNDIVEIDEIQTEKDISVEANGKSWSCTTSNGAVNSYTKCISDKNTKGYLGELV